MKGLAKMLKEICDKREPTQAINMEAKLFDTVSLKGMKKEAAKIKGLEVADFADNGDTKVIDISYQGRLIVLAILKN